MNDTQRDELLIALSTDVASIKTGLAPLVSVPTDVATMKTTIAGLDDRYVSHDEQRRSRRWTVGTLIAAIAAVEGVLALITRG